jgi:hypothetical protein
VKSTTGEGGEVVNTLSLFTTLLSLVFPALTTTGGLLALASTVAATVIVVLVVSHAHGGRLDLVASPIRGRGVALRERARRAAFLRLRDPNASGRPQPRAPGLRCLAA